MSRIIQHSRNHREHSKQKQKMNSCTYCKYTILQINDMRRPLYGTPLDGIVISDGERPY